MSNSKTIDIDAEKMNYSKSAYLSTTRPCTSRTTTTQLKNEGWNNIGMLSSNKMTDADVVVRLSNDSPVQHKPKAATKAAAISSPLDDFLSGHHNHKYPLGFTLSIPFQSEAQKEGTSCGESVASELTVMTYRAELMKKAITIEFDKFNQQKKEQDEETHPDNIRLFSRTLSLPHIQNNITSFVTLASARMKDEERNHCRQKLVNAIKENDDNSEVNLQQKVDELYVDFGVRPTKSTHDDQCDRSGGNANTTEPQVNDGLVYEQEAVTDDQHIESVIQLKLQLAQKQTIIDELSCKYSELLKKQLLENQVFESSEWNMRKVLAENAHYRRENERIRSQLNQLLSTAVVGDYQHHSTPPNLHQPSNQQANQRQRLFNIHQILQDRLNCATQESHSVETSGSLLTATATERSSTANESSPLQQTIKQLNSFSNLIQGWKRNQPAQQSSDCLVHRTLSVPTMGSINTIDGSQRSARVKSSQLNSVMILERPAPAA